MPTKKKPVKRKEKPPVAYECEHRFTDEPYCDLCGEPHGGYFGALKRIIGEAT